MKRIFLICCMLVVAATYTNAQEKNPALDVAPPVSKTEFTQKVKDLDDLIQHDNTAAADKKFEEITQMINAELKVTRYQMRDAKNEEQKNSALTAIKTQRTLYGQIMTMKSDMKGNRAPMVEKLNEFAATVQ